MGFLPKLGTHGPLAQKSLLACGARHAFDFRSDIRTVLRIPLLVCKGTMKPERSDAVPPSDADVTDAVLAVASARAAGDGSRMNVAVIAVGFAAHRSGANLKGHGVASAWLKQGKLLCVHAGKCQLRRAVAFAEAWQQAQKAAEAQLEAAKQQQLCEPRRLRAEAYRPARHGSCTTCVRPPRVARPPTLSQASCRLYGGPLARGHQPAGRHPARQAARSFGSAPCRYGLLRAPERDPPAEPKTRWWATSGDSTRAITQVPSKGAARAARSLRRATPAPHTSS